MVVIKYKKFAYKFQREEHVIICRRSENEYLVSQYSYLSSSYRLGSLGKPITGDTTRYLVSGLIDKFQMAEGELKSVLDVELIPVEVDGEIQWSPDISTFNT